jgi:predicted RNA-binding Zn ribbon-like protein
MHPAQLIPSSVMVVRQTPSGGGVVAVRLANSIVHASGRSRDLFDDIDERRAWARQLGRGDLTDGEAARLQELRGHVRTLLLAAADGEAPSREALDAVNAASGLAPEAPQLNWPQGGTPTAWRTTAATEPLDRSMALIARSAIEVVSSQRVGRCGAHGCTAVFVASDPRRRWCSVRCGNRVRVARHAARLRG